MFVFNQDFDHRWWISHPWALIDASWRDELPASWPVTVIAPAFLGDDTARCPVLLDLQLLPLVERAPFIDQLTAQARERDDTRASLLLSSPATREQLIGHLADRLVLRQRSGDAPRQLRYFDPGTFLQLPRVLGEAGMSWLLGPATSALVPWAGQWTEVVPPTAPAPHFRLRENHQQALVRIGAVNRVALQMVPAAFAADWVQRCQRIDAHVQRGMHAWSLSHVEDLAAFARHATTHHPVFDTHPLLAVLFAELRAAQPQDELDYRELSARLSADDWARVVRELPPPQEPKAVL